MPDSVLAPAFAGFEATGVNPAGVGMVDVAGVEVTVVETVETVVNVVVVKAVEEDVTYQCEKEISLPFTLETLVMRYVQSMWSWPCPS